MKASQPLPIERAEEHGEVFTRRWVVELILDLAGYVPDRDLAVATALEPSCGSGAFLVPVVERLLLSAREHGRSLEDAHDSLLAFDLLPGNVDSSRLAVRRALASDGVESSLADALSKRWVRCGDFLLDPPLERSVDFALGNPPYVRLESVPRERSDAYRRACRTMGGRADVYVGFYEHALRALRDGGVLSFICADRWMRNAYGARLRAMVTEGWAVDVLVSMTGVDAFEDEVDAYPAVTVLRRGGQTRGPLVIEASPGFDEREAREVAGFVRGYGTETATGRGYRAARLHGWFQGQAGWPSGSPDRLAVIAHLESSFPPLEDSDTGTRVGIGIATGADKVFIVEDPDLVEPQRLLPLALPRDIASGRVEWSGKLLANPWDADGLVDLRHWPQLAEYLGRYRSALAKRHTAKNGPWHKTIDRVIEGLAERPKLYLPDFKEAIFPVLDPGKTYPHHNLYWVTSDRWDLRVLGGILLSDVANLFIEAYSVRMRGGYLRFQAQYLRRIRVPEPSAIGPDAEEALARAFDTRDREAATETVLRLYGLDTLPA
jgi:adenine-specific DNA-methyltransferase